MSTILGELDAATATAAAIATAREREEEQEDPAMALRLVTASTPTSPGPSTPTALRTLPLGRIKSGEEDDIVPPARPSSTPFPRQELGEDRWPTIDEIQLRATTSTSPGEVDSMSDESPKPKSSPHCLRSLPTEIHENILDYLFQFRNSASVRSKLSKTTKLRNWSKELRHSRRKEVADLTLVCSKWKDLIQDRLYRHIKIKATRDSVAEAFSWFESNPHLAPYVKNIEFWFPVFMPPKVIEVMTIRTTANRSSSNLANNLLGVNPFATPIPMPETANNLTYRSPNNNCSLEEVFRFVQMMFSNASVLTLEGGDRKKPPQVEHFKKGSSSRSLPVLDKINALESKGQWNLFRTYAQWQNIANALPNLTEWHGKYAKPKSKSYICMATILPNLGNNLTTLNISLENDFRRETMSPSFARKVSLKTHFCVSMAEAVPTLERLEYTGRVCHCFFDIAASLSDPRESRLKSVHLTVKNCCRPQSDWSSDGSGITDMAFIHAFETLVISAAKSLERLAALESIRIKFIDLGKPTSPPLPPLSKLMYRRLGRPKLEPILHSR